MLLLAIEIAATKPTDFDALNKAVAACDRAAVSKAVAEDSKRHSGFLIQAYKDQRDIVTDRIAIAERPHRLRMGDGGVDTESAVTIATQDLDDRQRALDDQRMMDRLQIDLLNGLRQGYVMQCSGGTA